MILTEKYPHKYPYDWRTKKPTIFRATSQWFASVAGFREDALAALDGIEFIPASGASACARWCLAQRLVHLAPARVGRAHSLLLRHGDGRALMDESTIKHVTEIVRAKGTDAWWEMETEDLLPEQHKAKAASLRKGTDTMDVWFDSGSSWNGVVKQRGLTTPPTCTWRDPISTRLVPVVSAHVGGGERRRAVQNHPHARLRVGREGTQDVQESRERGRSEVGDRRRQT